MQPVTDVEVRIYNNAWDDKPEINFTTGDTIIRPDRQEIRSATQYNRSSRGYCHGSKAYEETKVTGKLELAKKVHDTAVKSDLLFEENKYIIGKFKAISNAIVNSEKLQYTNDHQVVISTFTSDKNISHINGIYATDYGTIHYMMKDYVNTGAGTIAIEPVPFEMGSKTTVVNVSRDLMKEFLDLLDKVKTFNKEKDEHQRKIGAIFAGQLQGLFAVKPSDIVKKSGMI